MNKLLSCAIVAGLLTVSGSAMADNLSFSGFGQVVAGSTGSDRDAFPGRNYDGDVNFKDESLFGLQVTGTLNDRVDAVAQIIARGDKDFDAELAWAYANIKLGNGFSTKVGRQRTALYRYSDFLDVGYAYPWLRTPYSVYNVGFSTLDGVSLTHTGFIGDKWFSQVQVQAGGYEGDVKSGSSYLDSELNNLRGVSWDLEYNEWLAFRAGYFKSDVTVTGSSLDGLVAQLNATGQGALAAQLDYNEDAGTFTNLGVRATRGNLTVEAEYVTVELEKSLFADKENWYVSGSYRIGEFVPYVTYGETQSNAKLDILASVNPANPFFPFVAGAVLTEDFDDKYYGAGVRWDFAENVAVKFDYTRFESDTNPLLTNRSDADAISAGLVFTF